MKREVAEEVGDDDDDDEVWGGRWQGKNYAFLGRFGDSVSVLQIITALAIPCG